MSYSSLESLKIKAKLLQKAKRKTLHEFSLKDAYALLASNAGYRDWKSMKDDYYLADLLNPPRWSAMWKVWFGTREEAFSNLDKNSFLLPYRKQFFLCDENYISALGLSPDDQDLISIGRDWTSPKDQRAWERVLEKIRKNQSA